MTVQSGRRRRRSSRRKARRLVLGVAVLAAVFATGLAIGDALHDNPATGDTQTLVRTLKPLELPPAEETVTVTVRR